MKCSNCSKTVRPVVAIDIDGTLGDYHTHFLLFASGWLGRTLDIAGQMYDGTERYRDWFVRTIGTDLTTFRAIKLAYRQGGLKRSIPMWPDAATFVNSLREFAEVWLTTTRPHDRFDRVDPDTREWLRRNGFGYDGLLYSGNKMEELAERVEPERVAFVLDDLAENLRTADEIFPGGATVLRRTRWNRAVEWPVTVASLLDARAIATAHVQDWNLKHNFDDLPTTD